MCDRYSDGIHFPAAQVLAYVPEEELADGTALGYRASYISSVAGAVCDGKLDIESISRLSYDEAYAALIQIKGIGPKVANCIMLYGFHFMESYPIDTWMKKIIAEDYQSYSKEAYLDYINTNVGVQHIFHRDSLVVKANSSRPFCIKSSLKPLRHSKNSSHVVSSRSSFT